MGISVIMCQVFDTLKLKEYSDSECNLSTNLNLINTPRQYVISMLILSVLFIIQNVFRIDWNITNYMPGIC